MHVGCLSVVRFPPFLLPLVPVCSHTLSECPAMFWCFAINFLIFISSKDSCFSIVFTFDRPICLVFHVAALVLRSLDFRKLPIHTSPLLPQKTSCFVDWCLRYSTLHFAISMFLVSPFLTICFPLLPSSHCCLHSC